MDDKQAHVADQKGTSNRALSAIITNDANKVKTNLHPRVPDAPGIILTTRDLMKEIGVPDRVREIFLDHAVTWMSPVQTLL